MREIMIFYHNDVYFWISIYHGPIEYDVLWNTATTKKVKMSAILWTQKNDFNMALTVSFSHLDKRGKIKKHFIQSGTICKQKHKTRAINRNMVIMRMKINYNDIQMEGDN